MLIKDKSKWSWLVCSVIVTLLLSGCSLFNNPAPTEVVAPTATQAAGPTVQVSPGATVAPSDTPPSGETTSTVAPTQPETDTPVAPAQLGTDTPQAPAPTPSGNVYYLDPSKGSDSNSGTATAPWKTIQKAVGSIHGGDTVVLNSGLYRIFPGGQFGIALLKLGPAGSPGKLTTFQAAPGARPIITNTNGNPVDIQILDYVRLDGLWMGGIQDIGTYKGQYGKIDHAISLGATSPEPIGEGKQVVNCTIWGYRSGLISGSTENLLVQGNRFILDGNDGLDHGIYLSGGDGRGSGQSNHLIVDDNILIGGEGYGIQSWHSVHDAIYTRNFITQHHWGTVLDGADHLEANNFFWKETGSSTIDPWGAWVPGNDIVFANNIMGPGAPLRVGVGGLNNRYSNNVFAVWSRLFVNATAATYIPRGDGQVVLSQSQDIAKLGVSSEQDLDRAIAALQKSFSQPADAIYADKSIEANFAELHFKIAPGSPLYQTGMPWFGQRLNIGPDSPIPADWNAWWAAFHGLGLHDWDRSGNMLK